MKNKSLKKIILTLIVSAALLAGTFSATVFASDELPEDNAASNVAESEIGEKVDTDTHISESNAKDTENTFSSVFEFFEKNSAKILSALSFIASLITVIAYKSGLLPYVQNGVKALSTAVKTLGERAESIESGTGDFKDQVEKKLVEAEALLERIEGTVGTIGERLDAIEADSSRKDSLKSVLENEIDMLYDVFMAASMPQYLKERVGERVNAMKRELAEAPNENEADT